MVQHLTLSVERWWFRAVVAGDPEVIDKVGSQDSAWQVAPEAPAGEVLDRYRHEAALVDAVIAEALIAPMCVRYSRRQPDRRMISAATSVTVRPSVLTLDISFGASASSPRAASRLRPTA